MKSILKLSAVAAAVVLATAQFSSAGPIDSACIRSDRKQATRGLCNCIQQVADMTLRNADQRRAAKFFSDPDLAHTVWVSQTPADDAFWERYKQFGTLAEAYCGGG